MSSVNFMEKLLDGVDVEWKALGEISEIFGGLTGKSKADFDNGNAKFVSYKNIFNNIDVDESTLELVRIKENERQHKVNYGDVLFTGSSEIAEEAGMSSAVTVEFNEPVYLNSFSFGVRFNDNIKLTPEFSKYLFRCPFMRAEIAKAANGVTRFNVSKARFKKIQIPIPCPENPRKSLDFAVFEKSKVIAVVPCDIGWSDIGSWAAMGELTPADENGNRVDGNAQLFDAKNCYIRSKNRLVGAVGVENLIIVDTVDALLVVNGDRAQDVKRIYADLKTLDHESHKLHRTVYRPWGSYTVLEEGNHFKIKRIEVKPHSSLSLQMHQHRSEHWVVLKGEAKIVNGEQELTIKRDESTFIPAGHKHRLSNATDIPLIIIEVQTGKYVGEDDIIRFEDVYGRC